MYAGPLCTKAPPELLHTPPTIDAPMQEEPITECGSRPYGASTSSRPNNVLPGKPMICCALSIS